MGKQVSFRGDKSEMDKYGEMRVAIQKGRYEVEYDRVRKGGNYERKTGRDCVEHKGCI